MFNYVFHVTCQHNLCCNELSEIDMGKSGENVFGLSFQRDFECPSLKSSLQHKFY